MSAFGRLLSPDRRMRGDERRGGPTDGPSRRVFAALVAASAWIGLAVQFDATLAANGSAAAALWILVRYFTILVGLAVALVFTGLALRPRPAPAAVMGGILLNALLVAAVYHLVIAGTLTQTGQEKLADLFLHSVTPAAVALFWLTRVPRGGLRPGDVGPWAAVPLVYFAYALARGGADGIYPYSFMDVPRIGWAATALDAALIAAGFLVAGFGLVWADLRIAASWNPVSAHASLPPMAVTDDPVLLRFRAALDAAYGDRIERVVLFGSRARGDARPDSDYDVAVFLRDFDDFGQESRMLAAIETDFLYEDGASIGSIPLRAGSYDDRTGFMAEVRRDGLDL